MVKLYNSLMEGVAKIWNGFVRSTSLYKTGYKKGRNDAFAGAEEDFDKHLELRMSLSQESIRKLDLKNATLEGHLRGQIAENRTLAERVEHHKSVAEEYRRDLADLRGQLATTKPHSRWGADAFYGMMKTFGKQLSNMLPEEKRDRVMMFVSPDGKIDDFNDRAKKKIRGYQDLIGLTYQDFLKMHKIAALGFKHRQARFVDLGGIVYNVKPSPSPYDDGATGAVILERVSTVKKQVAKLRKEVAKFLKARRKRESSVFA